MKFFIVLFACVAAVLSKQLTEEQKKILQPHEEACLAEVGIDKAFLMNEKVKAEKTAKEGGNVVLDHKVGCFSACMFKRLSFMTDEGEMDEDIIRAFGAEQIPSDILETAIEKCKGLTGKDECETAAMTIVCFAKHGAVVEV